MLTAIGITAPIAVQESAAVANAATAVQLDQAEFGGIMPLNDGKRD